MSEIHYERKLIEYDDKVKKGSEGAEQGNNDTFRAKDANEIKEVVNHNAEMTQVVYDNMGDLYDATFIIVITIGMSIDRLQRVVRPGTTMTNILRWQVTVKDTPIPVELCQLYCNGALLSSDPDARQFVHQFYGLAEPGKMDYSVRVKYENAYGTREAIQSAELVFVAPTYYGPVDRVNPTAAQVSALEEVLHETKEHTQEHVAYNYSRFCYAYPKVYGDLVAILDQNGFNYITSFTKSELTINGIAYNCYVLTEPVTIEDSTYIFK
jgi:hypothetical protein